MLFRRDRKIEPLLDPVIDRILEDMDMFGPTSDEYPKLVKRLGRVVELRNRQKKRVSADTVAIVVGNLLGILIIVAYEQKGIITSKGLGFIGRGPTQPRGLS